MTDAEIEERVARALRPFITVRAVATEAHYHEWPDVSEMARAAIRAYRECEEK